MWILLGRPAVKWVLSALAGAALIEALHAFGLYPDRWVASLITMPPSDTAVQLVFWSIVALVSALLFYSDQKWFPYFELIYKRLRGRSKLETLRHATKVPLYEAYEWLKDRSAWRAQYDREHKGQKPFPPLAPIPELKRAIRDGALKVYGCANGLGSHVPSTYWLSAELDLDAFFDHGNVGRTKASVPGVAIYDNLVVNSADIFALRPIISVSVAAKAMTEESMIPPDCPDCKYIDESGNLCTNPKARNHASGTWHTCVNVRADVDLCGNKARWFVPKSS